jgi:short-subunit dehydrogenase
MRELFMTDPSFADKYGPWALIAGGSEGTGKSFAALLAAQGIHLILVARNAEPLGETAAEIRGKFSVQVQTAALDLTAADLEHKVDSLCAGKDIGMLIYNAGATHGAGFFLDQPLDRAMNLVRLNCIGPVTLIHKLGNRMKQRGRGGIILMSSMSGLAGGGFVAAYGATKSFEITLAEALWFELGTVGVDVLGLIGGATRTPAMARSGAKFGSAGEQSSSGPNIVPMESDEVASEALAQLGKGPVWVAGENNRQSAKWLRGAPREQLVPAMSAAAAQIYGLPLPRFRS